MKRDLSRQLSRHLQNIVDGIAVAMRTAALIALVRKKPREVGRGKQEIKGVLGNGLRRKQAHSFSLGRPPALFRHFYFP